MTSRLALTRGHPLVTDVHAVTPEAGGGGGVDVHHQHTVEEIVKARPLALARGFGSRNRAKKVCIY